MLLLAAGLALALLSSAGGGSVRLVAERAGGDVPAREPRETPDVRVALHLEESLDETGTVVWTAAFQAAWDALAQALGFPAGIPLDLPAPALDVRALNEGRLPPGLVPLGALTVIAGPATQETWNAIDRVSDRDRPAGAPSPNRDDVVVFARLKASARYGIPFFLHDRPIEFGPSGVAVRAYGLLQDASGEVPDRIRAQARIHIPGSQGSDVASRAVVVLTGTDGTRVVVSARPPGATLGATWADVSDVLDAVPSRAFERIDRLAIPRVGIRAKRSFDELLRATIGGNPDAWIEVAEESVTLTVDEKGADVDAEAVLVSVGAVPLRVNIDGPFLLALLAPGQERPYVVAWIGSAAALSRWDEPADPVPSRADVAPFLGDWTLDRPGSVEATVGMHWPASPSHRARRDDAQDKLRFRDSVRARYEKLTFDLTVSPNSAPSVTLRRPALPEPGPTRVALVLEGTRMRLLLGLPGRLDPDGEEQPTEERWTAVLHGDLLHLRCDARGELLVLRRRRDASGRR